MTPAVQRGLLSLGQYLNSVNALVAAHGVLNDQDQTWAGFAYHRQSAAAHRGGTPGAQCGAAGL